MEPIAKRIGIIGLALTALFGMSEIYLNVGNAHHIWPFPSGSNWSPPYWHNWSGQIPMPFPIPIPGSSPITSIQLDLKLGPQGVDNVIGKISSPTLGCAEVVYLASAHDPITLKLSTSQSSLECQALSALGSATISLVSDTDLRLAVDIEGITESCDLFR